MGAADASQIKASVVDGLLSAVTDAEKDRAKLATSMVEEVSFVRHVADSLPSDTSVVWFARLQKRVWITRVSLIAQDTLIASDINFATVSLRSTDGLGGPETIHAAQSTTVSGGGTGSWANGLEETITMTANRLVSADAAPRYLLCRITKGGTGVAVPAFTLFVTYELI